MVRRAPVFQQPRTAGGCHPLVAEGILEPNRNPGQGPEIIARDPPGVDLAGGLERPLTVYGQEGVHLVVNGRDLVQMGLDQFYGGHFSGR